MFYSWLLQSLRKSGVEPAFATHEQDGNKTYSITLINPMGVQIVQKCHNISYEQCAEDLIDWLMRYGIQSFAQAQNAENLPYQRKP